jgi:hypothetical protein
MSSPYSHPSSVTPLNAGPSRTLLQQLLEEINGAPTAPTAHNGCTSQSTSRTRSSSQTHSPSVWVNDTPLAQDARDKLRAADEAHQRTVAVNTIDCAPGMRTPTLRLDTSGFRTQGLTGDDYGKGPVSGIEQTPDPVKYPHDYMHYMMKGSPLSTSFRLSPATEGHDNTRFPPQAHLTGNDMSRPLSPLMFSDVDYNDSSCSPQTETTASPIGAPTSAATIYTAEEPLTPSDNGSVYCMYPPSYFELWLI